MHTCTQRMIQTVAYQHWEMLPTGGFKSIVVGQCRQCGEWRKVFSVIDPARQVYKDLILKPGESRGEGALRRAFNHDEIPKENQ